MLLRNKKRNKAMDVRYKKNSEELTVYIYGEVDEFSALSAKEILDKIIYKHLNSEKVIFDLSGLTFMDSTGIGLLIGRYKKLKSFNIPSYITGASAPAEKVLSLSGIYKIMPKC